MTGAGQVFRQCKRNCSAQAILMLVIFQTLNFCWSIPVKGTFLTSLEMQNKKYMRTDYGVSHQLELIQFRFINKIRIPNTDSSL